MLERTPLKQQHLKIVKLGIQMKQQASKIRSHVHAPIPILLKELYQIDYSIWLIIIKLKINQQMEETLITL